MKKCLVLVIALIILVLSVSIPVSAAPSDLRVMVSGEYVRFDKSPIVIDNRTLVPMRAVCEKIGAKVEWNAITKTISVTKDDIVLSLQIGNSSMLVNDGSTVTLEVPPIAIDGYTFLPIRDVVAKLGYEVTWSQNDKTILIEEIGTVIVAGLENTQARSVSNWASISSVQQFAYKNEGIAYAYVSGSQLIVKTPTKKLNIEMRYPKLGDILSDEDGYIYIIWGKTNETGNSAVETIFISKYTPEGTHEKTTGFDGKSSPWGNSDSAKTRIPFDAGNCVSVIANGILVCYHAKERYDGHQSDNAIAVRTSDMSVYDLPNNTFSGHSFNQSIIFSRKTSGFLFASHGDAFARGFRVNNSSGGYGENSEILFHFYLQANANYDMWIVNKTFAQLGGLAETSAGVALIGASAKSIGEAAKAEKQNLFIQIFNPLAGAVSPSMFIGGTERSGATSMDIYDNKNSPLTSVTDYGVHWLTNYTDTDVIAPQVVEADDKLVILWSTANESFYMILSASGEVITPTTSLGGLALNSFERPIYHNGAIFWAGVRNGRLNIRSIVI